MSTNPSPAVQTMPPMAQGSGAFPIHPSGSLYVGDLAPDVTEAILFEIFSRAGAVSSIRVCRDSSTRRSLGYAYVNFHSMLDAERALDTLNFSTIKDRACRVMWSHRDPSIRKNTRSNIFVKNLAQNIDSKALYDTFSQFGNILSCKVATDVAGHSKGFGYVHFENEEVAQKAIDAVNDKLISGKKVYAGKFERRTDRLPHVTRFTNVYVKNLPQDWDEQKLKDSFGQFGKITSLAFKKSQDRHNGLGYGFVNYETHEEAYRAVEQGSKLVVNNQPIFVDRFQKKQERLALLSKLYDERKRERTEKFKNMNLYVKNLDEDVDDAKLRELFAPFGETTSVIVMKDPNSGASRGFGFVCFSNPDDATKALSEMNGKVIGSKPLYVNRAQRKDERKSQLEVAFMSGQRVQPMAMYFPPNMPIQHMMFAHPAQQYRPRPNFPPQPAAAPVRGYPQQMQYPYAQNQRGRNQQQQPPSARGGYAANARGGNPKFRGGAGGHPAQNRYPREQVVAPVMQPTELSANMLANASPEMQKQILGERLYPLVYKEQPELAAKITGMFLEMETAEILTLLDSPAELVNKIQEALTVLNTSASQ